eukprot:6195223-Pleurochrysis_carterae.AAC.3
MAAISPYLYSQAVCNRRPVRLSQGMAITMMTQRHIPLSASHTMPVNGSRICQFHNPRMPIQSYHLVVSAIWKMRR